jgi:hypothetical protein
MTAPKPNAELAYRVLDHIDAHPEQHDQRVWIENRSECGTAACLAGWVCLLSGDRPDFDHEEDEACEVFLGKGDSAMPVAERAASLLGIPYDEWESFGNPLFSQYNTREDLGRLVEEIFGPRPDVAEIVDHGPVKPPYGTPEREAYDREQGGAR